MIVYQPVRLRPVCSPEIGAPEWKDVSSEMPDRERAIERHAGIEEQVAAGSAAA